MIVGTIAWISRSTPSQVERPAGGGGSQEQKLSIRSGPRSPVTVTQHTGLTSEEMEAVIAPLLAQVADAYEHVGALKEQLGEALRRAEAAERGAATAGEREEVAGVLQALRESGDASRLLAFLMAELQRDKDDVVARNREIAAVAYVTGDIGIAEDALKEILARRPDDTEAINRLGHIRLLRGELDQAEDLYEQALRLGEERRDERARASAYGNLGAVHQTRGDLHKAEEMYMKALEISEQLAWLEGMASAYGNLGLIYRTRGDLDGAEEMHTKSLEIETKLGRLEGMAKQYCNLGLIHQTRGDLDRAEEMHTKSLDIETKLRWLEGMGRQYSNLGLIHLTRGDLDRAEEMQRKSLEIDEKLGRLEGMATDYGNLGVIYLTRGDLDRAEEMLRKSLEIDDRLGRLEGTATDYANLGGIYRARGDLDCAEEMHKKSLEIDKKLGWLEGMANNYANLGSICCDDRGDVARAREYWTNARDLYREIGIDHMAKQMQDWLDGLGTADIRLETRD